MGKFFMRRKEIFRSALVKLVGHLEGDDLVMVEIGSFAGESTKIFAKSGRFSKIFAIDPWIDGQIRQSGAEPYKKYSMGKIEKNFDNRMAEFDFLVKIKGFSSDVVDQFEEESLDFLYIDGNHDYEYVKEDIHKWLPKVKKEGYISGHDWTLRGVRKAVEEELGTPEKVFKDSSWVFKVKNI